MKLFYVPVLLISMVVGTWAIDCYTCTGGACNDPFNQTGSGVSNTCPSAEAANRYCLKSVSGSTVTRTCSPTCAEACAGGSCLYCCNSNLCNGGTTLTTRFVAMGVAILAAFILARQ